MKRALSAQETYPPPPSSPVVIAAASTGAVAPGWEAVAAELSGIGLRETASAVAEVRGRGLSPADVLALVAYFRAHQSRWEARRGDALGVLRHRLRLARAAQRPDVGWIPFSVADRGDAPQRELIRDRERAQRRNDVERRAAERSESARLEESFGGQLDGLGDAELAALVAVTYSATVAESSYVRHQLRHRPIGGIVREALLKQLGVQQSG